MRALALPFALSAALATSTWDARAAGPKTNDCVDAFERGQGLRDEKKLGEARAAFLQCARDACPTVLRKDCTRWVEEIDRDMGSLVIRVVDARDRDLQVTDVWIDGVRSGGGTDGWSVTVTPGRHSVRAAVEGQPPVEESVVVAQGEKNRTVLLRIAPKQTEPPAVTGPPPKASSDASPSKSRGLPAGFFLAGGVAVASFATFAYAGITGSRDLDRLHDDCGVTRACTSDDVSPVRTKLLVADVAGAIGVVALGLAVYLLIDHATSGPRATGRTVTAPFSF